MSHNTNYGNETATRLDFLRCFYPLYPLYLLHKADRFCFYAVAMLPLHIYNNLEDTMGSDNL